MKLRKCEKGHFYDEEKYDSCPHCQNMGGQMPSQPQQGGEEGMTVGLYNDSPQAPAGNFQPNPGPVPNSGFQTVPIEPAPGESLKENVQKIQQEEENRTVGYYMDELGQEPVVGWLVCIEGEKRGEAFVLKSGRNFIGRGAGMDVVLSGDRSVSRDKHAILVYEPRARIFLVQPGESRELFYVNDEVVLSNRQLKDRDVLMIGNYKLLFVPLCGPDFSWDD